MPISSALGSSALLPAGLGFRNVIINGGFDIWQRGTSTFDGTAYRYTADRWQAVRGGFASGQSLTRQTASLDGFRYCTRVSRDSGNTSTAILYLAQTVETANSIQFQNKQAVVSFYARAGANYSASGSVLNVRLETGTGTDQNHFNGGFTNGTNIINSNVTLTTTWQRFTLSGFAASTITQIGLTFLFTPTGTAGASDYFEITGVQLEQNYQPTPFEQRPYQTELALCQRYYEKTYDIDTIPTTNINNGMMYTTSSTNNAGFIFLTCRFAVPKRYAGYTVTFYRNTGTANVWTYARSGTSADTTMNYTYVGTNAFTAYTSNIGVGWVVAEVYGHWVCNAEL